jgi:hypothetical protein
MKRRRKVRTIAERQHRNLRLWAFSILALAMLLLSNTCEADTIFDFTITGPTTSAQGVIDAELVPAPVLEWNIVAISGTFDGSAIIGPGAGFDALLDLGNGTLLPFMVFDTTAGNVTWAWVGNQIVDVIYPGFSKVEQVTDTFSSPPPIETPEPPSLALLMLGDGLLIIAWLRRRREA